MYDYLKIITGEEKKQFIKELRTQFGISDIPETLIKRGQERVFLFSGELSEKEIIRLSRILPIERVGIYIAKIEDREVRLSLEGAQYFKDKITHNTLELTEQEFTDWMHGNEIYRKNEVRGFVILTYKKEVVGCGKASAEKIGNFIPKNRRVRDRA